jgi:hypothetical protein
VPVADHRGRLAGIIHSAGRQRRTGGDHEGIGRGGDDYHEAEQFAFGFEENQSAGRLFPACSETGSYDDLHLVVYEDGGKTTAKLLCPQARAKVAATTTVSLPLALVWAETLARLETLGKLPVDSDVIRALRQSLADDLSAEWEAFRQLKAQRQSGLGFEFGDELRLG